MRMIFKDIQEINTGVICFNKDRLLDSLNMSGPIIAKEYYLTDTIGILYKKVYFR